MKLKFPKTDQDASRSVEQRISKNNPSLYPLRNSQNGQMCIQKLCNILAKVNFFKSFRYITLTKNQIEKNEGLIYSKYLKKLML